MALIDAKIIANQPLANGFHQLTLECNAFMRAQPGQYISIEQEQRCYVMSQNENQADFMIPPNASITLLQNTVTHSILQGDAITPPKPEDFYLITADLSTLGAWLFYFKKYKPLFNGLIFIEANGPFPFYPAPSRKIIPFLPSDVIATLPLLEDWGISNRLVNAQDTPGCFCGTAETLANLWVKNNSNTNIQRIVLT